MRGQVPALPGELGRLRLHGPMPGRTCCGHVEAVTCERVSQLS